MSDSVEVIEVDFLECKEEIRAVRFEVFVDEQRVPAEIEMDEWDERSRHVLAFCGSQPVGTGRLLPDGHIGRVAVLKPFRGSGVGAALMKHLIEMGRLAGMQELALSAQTHAAGFYEGLGFRRRGATYQEAGIEHIEMRLSL